MSDFSDRVLTWYDKNARVLPWRGVHDPYKVWVSEIMLQQTRVETVIPYFERWMRQFPTIAELAYAPLQTVLSAWEGLGYYSRVRNLHKAAKIVMTDYGGQIPPDVDTLRKLPGIGRYTAAAIISIAFNQNIATLDGNLRRVFARVFNVSLPADSKPGSEILWDLAQQHLAHGRAGDYNQALMDLGSAVCLPKKPLCLVCPLMDLCQSRADPESRPVLKPKSVVPHQQKMAAVIIQDAQVLLSLRPETGLLGGMWEFPAVKVDHNSIQALKAGLQAEYGILASPAEFLIEIQHAYTHFTLAESAWYCDFLGLLETSTVKWIHLSSLDDYPMGKVDRAIAGKLKTGPG